MDLDTDMDVVGSGIGMEIERARHDTKQYKRFTICGIYCLDITDSTILEAFYIMGWLRRSDKETDIEDLLYKFWGQLAEGNRYQKRC